MRCDLDPNKICDNCGKCLASSDNDDEFRSVVVSANDFSETTAEDGADEEFDDHELSEEERQLMEFLDAPIDLHVPEPIEVDPELMAKWEKILAEKEEEERRNEEPDISMPEISLHGSRKRRDRKNHS